MRTKSKYIFVQNKICKFSINMNHQLRNLLEVGKNMVKKGIIIFTWYGILFSKCESANNHEHRAGHIIFFLQIIIFSQPSIYTGGGHICHPKFSNCSVCSGQKHLKSTYELVIWSLLPFESSLGTLRPLLNEESSFDTFWPKNPRRTHFSHSFHHILLAKCLCFDLRH